MMVDHLSFRNPFDIPIAGTKSSRQPYRYATLKQLYYGSFAGLV